MAKSKNTRVATSTVEEGKPYKVAAKVTIEKGEPRMLVHRFVTPNHSNVERWFTELENYLEKNPKERDVKSRVKKIRGAYGAGEYSKAAELARVLFDTYPALNERTGKQAYASLLQLDLDGTRPPSPVASGTVWERMKKPPIREEATGHVSPILREVNERLAKKEEAEEAYSLLERERKETTRLHRELESYHPEPQGAVIEKGCKISPEQINGGKQVRCRTDGGQVEQFAEICREALAESKDPPFPPVILFAANDDADEYILADGFHRLEGHKKGGCERILADVYEGGEREAFLYALKANGKHGLQFNTADKRQIATTLLDDPEWGQWTDREIARQSGLSAPTVGKLRKERESSVKNLQIDAPKIVERNGSRYTMSVGNIGRGKTEKPEAIKADTPPPPLASEQASGSDEWVALPQEGEAPARTELPTVVVEGKAKAYITLDCWKTMSKGEQRRVLTEIDNNKSKFNAQGSNENIEWALWSWNPVTGCEHNCPYCYARDIANRFYDQGFTPSLWPERLLAPKNTTFPALKAAEWMGHKNVFTCSMADLFGRWVPTEWIEAVLDAVRAAPQWNFLFLTKFPIRLSEFEFPDNAWVGTSVDCQARVANAERAFRKVKAGVKWLSCEPLIEPLVFSDLGAFDWIVLGGASKSAETPEWKPPHEWVNAIEAEAARVGVKVYEKTNLRRPERIRQYPGVDAQEECAPDALQYLAKVEASR